MDLKKNYSSFIKTFFISLFVFLFIIASVIVLVDPFFHYHKPLFGLKAVQTKKEYQQIGAIEHLEYDSILVGSSTVMNMNTSDLDNALSCKTIKLVGNSASTEYLCWYIEKAFEEKELLYVFYGLDVFSLFSRQSGTPVQFDNTEYIYNDILLDDIKYVLNKDVLFEDVPYMMYNSYIDNYDEGTAYNFAQHSVFGEQVVRDSYVPRQDIAPMRDYKDDEAIVNENMDSIKTIIEEHPETQFRFFFPTYSILYWDRAYRNGEIEEYVYAMKLAMTELSKYENVKFYHTDFADESVITELDNYMDLIHGSFDINDKMAEDIINDNNYLDIEEFDKETGWLLEFDYEEYIDKN